MAATKKKELARLRAGKVFHARIQSEWLATAKGEVKPERYVDRIGKSRGRVDILVDEEEDTVTIVELKATNWDRIESKNVRRNVLRHARQVWGYVQAQVELHGKNVCPWDCLPSSPIQSRKTTSD